LHVFGSLINDFKIVWIAARRANLRYLLFSNQFFVVLFIHIPPVTGRKDNNEYHNPQDAKQYKQKSIAAIF